VVRNDIAKIDRQHVSYWDLFWVPVSFATCCLGVLFGEVDGECSLGSINIACKAARALLVASVADDPDCGVPAAFVIPHATE
jgi:hypothetical protein